ncbi:hypothetical protein ACSGFH_04120 [Streptococcus agalactiae]
MKNVHTLSEELLLIGRTELEYYMPNFIYKDHLLPLDDDRYFQMTLWVNENLISEMLLDISEHFKNHHIRLTSSGFGCIDVLPADVNKADASLFSLKSGVETGSSDGFW